MKPLSLCLVQMGDKGLEMVKAHPNVLPKEVLNELVIKSMPLGAKPGDFATAGIGDIYFSSYIFSIPRKDQRNNIGAMVAVFNDMKYNIEGIKRIFSFIIKELNNRALLKVDVIEELLPNLYKGFGSGSIKIQISSVATITIDFDDKKSDEKGDETNGIAEDIWR